MLTPTGSHGTLEELEFPSIIAKLFLAKRILM